MEARRGRIKSRGAAKREMIRGTKYRARDIYPKLTPELEAVFEEWTKAHPRKQK